MLDAGDDAPDVSARNQDGDLVDPDFDDPTVVYFYPKDDTPGCTIEAKQFNAELDAYADAGVDIYGVSLDDVDSHDDFREKYGLEFDLLADPDGDLAEAFGVDTSEGYTERVTFVLANGEVTHAYEGVKPDGHARNVLEDILDDGLATLD